MKRYTYILLFLCVLVSMADCRLLLAQYEPQIIFTSPPVPVGSGARAIGMGSAFIAVADDATAASWNPGGLTQLRRPEFSVVYAYNKRFEDYSSSIHPESSGNNHTTMEDLNYLSVAYPFELCQRNMLVSLNYQMLYSFDRNLKWDRNTSSGKTPWNEEVDFRQRGSLKTLSPAYCIQVTPELSVGTTFNIWTDELFWGNGWNSTQNITTKQYYNHRLKSKTYTGEYKRFSSFKGFNMNLGFLWKVNRVLTIGGVLKTPFRAGVKYKKTVTYKRIQLTDRSYSVEEDSPATKKEDLDFYMPLSYGVGMALRLSDKLTVSGDVTITDWSKFVLEDSQGRRYSPITGKQTKDSHVHATTQVRLGGEYLFILTNTVIPVRAGLFYDPEPAQNHANDFWGCSLGTGVSLGNLILDIAYQFRYGRNVNGTALDMPQRDADVSQHSFLASAIYHF